MTVASSSTELYQRAVLEHNKSPRFYGELVGATHSARGHNPICGDVVHVEAIVADEIVTNLQFTAQSCALCKASASMMCESLQKQPVESILTEVNEFLRVLKGEEVSAVHSQSIEVFSIVRDFPARAKCVMLPWRTLLGALTKAEVLVSTEKMQA